MSMTRWAPPYRTIGASRQLSQWDNVPDALVRKKPARSESKTLSTFQISGSNFYGGTTGDRSDRN